MDSNNQDYNAGTGLLIYEETPLQTSTIENLVVLNSIDYQGNILDPSLKTTVLANSGAITSMKGTGWTDENLKENADNITTNTTSISTNATNISTNTTSISTNASNISTNASNITTNASSISTNASNISTNTSNISGKVSKSGDTMTGALDLDSQTLKFTAENLINYDAGNNRLDIHQNSSNTDIQNVRFINSSTSGFITTTTYPLTITNAGIDTPELKINGSALSTADFVSKSDTNAQSLVSDLKITGGDKLYLQSSSYSDTYMYMDESDGYWKMYIRGNLVMDGTTNAINFRASAGAYFVGTNLVFSGDNNDVAMYAGGSDAKDLVLTAGNDQSTGGDYAIEMKVRNSSNTQYTAMKIQGKTEIIEINRDLSLDDAMGIILEGSTAPSSTTNKLYRSSSDLYYNANKLGLDSDITTNASNISTNASNISTNSSGISTNATAITGKISKSGDTMDENVNLNFKSSSDSYIKWDSTHSRSFQLYSDGGINIKNDAGGSDILISSDRDILLTTTNELLINTSNLVITTGSNLITSDCNYKQTRGATTDTYYAIGEDWTDLTGYGVLKWNTPAGGVSAGVLQIGSNDTEDDGNIFIEIGTGKIGFNKRLASGSYDYEFYPPQGATMTDLLFHETLLASGNTADYLDSKNGTGNTFSLKQNAVELIRMSDNGVGTPYTNIYNDLNIMSVSNNTNINMTGDILEFNIPTNNVNEIIRFSINSVKVVDIGNRNFNYFNSSGTVKTSFTDTINFMYVPLYVDELYSSGSNDLVFGLNGTEKMKIDNTNDIVHITTNVMIGSGNQYGALTINDYNNVAGTNFTQYNYYFYSGMAPASGTGYLGTGTYGLALHCYGWANAWGWITFSDKRIKTNVRECKCTLELIDKLNVVDYEYIDIVRGGGLRCGFLAQEVEKILPNAIKNSSGFIPDYYKIVEKVKDNCIKLGDIHNYNIEDKLKLINNDKIGRAHV